MLFLISLSTLMIPLQVIMVTLFKLVTSMGLYGSYWAVILPTAASALLFRQLSPHVTLFLHTVDELDDGAWEQLAALDVEVVTGVVDRLRVASGTLRAVVLADGHEQRVDAVVVAPRFEARGDLYRQLGGEVNEHPMSGTFVETDPMGRTAVAGVWAAGNARDLQAMVSAASADGVRAGAAVNADLVAEDAAAAVQARYGTVGAT